MTITMAPMLAAELRSLQLAVGRPLLMHTSLRRIGCGSPATLYRAVREVVTDATTIVVPSQTPNNSLSSRAYLQATAGLSGPALAAYHATMVGFDRSTTPSFGMGAFAEYVRRTPGAVRSGHPQTSFTAVGPAAAAVTDTHAIGCHLGDSSPLGALYDADAHVLLVGVGYAACTCFHLAEYRCAHGLKDRSYRCFVQRDGAREPVDFIAPDLCDEDFPAIGVALDHESFVCKGFVGNASARAFPLRAAVDFAIAWMDRHRG